jgi:hypothetical protein
MNLGIGVTKEVNHCEGTKPLEIELLNTWETISANSTEQSWKSQHGRSLNPEKVDLTERRRRSGVNGVISEGVR